MKRLHFALLALAAFALCSCATTTPQPAAAGSAASPTASATAMNMAEMEKTVIDLEKKAWESFRTKNVEEMRKVAAPGSRDVTASGVQEAEVSIKDIGNTELKDVTFSDWKVSFPVPDTAIVTYKDTQTSSYKGKDRSGSYYSSAVWVKIDGKWKNALYTETKAEPQPAK